MLPRKKRTFGGPMDNSSAGALWIFSRSGTIWNQIGELVGGSSQNLGGSAALSADGYTAITGAAVSAAGGAIVLANP